MKKVLAYGVGNIELRRKIEKFMDNGYQIVAYTDSYAKKDFCDGKKFVKPRDIMELGSDYIIVGGGRLHNRKFINY